METFKVKRDCARREFLRLASLGLAGSSLRAEPRAQSLILIWQSGGCSHLDTFDMKPDAPREYRGEFRPIRTNVPGVWISEHLPLLARQMDKITLIRSMQSPETNHERARNRLKIGGAFLPAAMDRSFEQACMAARRATAAGRRFVFVPQGWGSYDTHRDNFRTLRDHVLPEFDRGVSGLLEDLDACGLLSTTLVAIMGEFGRSPRINLAGGRDHHSQAWSVLLAGAGLPGGRVIGATDRLGEEVIDAPMSPEDLKLTIQSLLGFNKELIA